MAKLATEIAPLTEFYYAEDYHQQYLAKNTFGYCGLGGTGVLCPTAVASSSNVAGESNGPNVRQ